MSQSNYNNDRYNDRDRNRNSYDDRDSTHHGRWTASGSADLSNPNYGRQSGSGMGMGMGHRDRGFSSGSSGYDQGFGGSHYGNIPTPPPMPPTDFWRHGGNNYQDAFDHPQFGSGYGMGMPHSQFGGMGMHPQSQFGGMGMHPQHSQFGGMGMHPQQFGSGYEHYYTHPQTQHMYGSGFGSHSSDMGMMQQYHFGQPSFGTGMGMHPQYSQFGGMGMLPQHSQFGGMGMQSRSMSSHNRPSADVYEVGNDYIIELDLPGHSREHIDTKLFGNELLITSTPPKREHNFHLNERSLGQGTVTRKLYLPNTADSSKINAALSNGVLKIIIPRTQGTVLPVQSSTQQPQILSQPKTVVTTDVTQTTTETKRV